MGKIKTAAIFMVKNQEKSYSKQPLKQAFELEAKGCGA